MSNTVITQDVALSTETGAVELNERPKMPAPRATGNDKIEILKHYLSNMDGPVDGANRARPGLELAIRNASTSTIATAMFEAVLYDQEGNIVETIKHKEIALQPDRSRGILLSFPPYYEDKVKSYDVKITRMTTADVEKVQLRRHEAKTNEAGEEEITGIVKNISNVKTDAAVIATFFDTMAESIGTKVVLLRDIEPDTTRQYELKFKPPEGVGVSSFTLSIGEIA